MISIAILGAVIGPMLQSSFASSQLSAQSAETQQALRVLESARSTLLGASTADVVDAAGALAPGVNMNLPGALQDQVVTYQFPDWSAPAPLPSLLALRIQIDWTGSRGDARSLAIVDAVKR